MPIVSTIADTLGIIGFFLTIYVAWSLRYIRRHYELQARLPQLLRKLQRYRMVFESMLGSYPENASKLPSRLAQCEAVLENLQKKKTIGELAARATRTMARLREVQTNLNRTNLDRFYNELDALIVAIHEQQRDMPWSKK